MCHLLHSEAKKIFCSCNLIFLIYSMKNTHTVCEGTHRQTDRSRDRQRQNEVMIETHRD